MDKLKIMLEDYKLNPESYSKVINAYLKDPDLFNKAIRSFGKEIETPDKVKSLFSINGLSDDLMENEQLLKFAKALPENSWLSDPENVIEKLPRSFMKAFDEQLLFIKDDGYTVMHGDAHTGNFFITTNEANEIIPEFIDTGLCVTRTSDDIANDVVFFTSYFTGNSDGVAEYFVNNCTNLSAENKAQMTKELSQYLDEKVFGSNKNITEVGKVIENIQDELGNIGISVNPEAITAMKAQIQFLSVAQELAKLADSSLDIPTVIKDVPKAIGLLIKNGTSPFKIVSNLAKGVRKNSKQSVASATQFLLRGKTKADLYKKMLQELD